MPQCSSCKKQIPIGSKMYACCYQSIYCAQKCTRTCLYCRNNLKSVCWAVECKDCKTNQNLTLSYCIKCTDLRGKKFQNIDKPFHQNNRLNLFLGGLDAVSIQEALLKLAPKCQQCDEQKMQFCTEKICTLNPLFCLDCNSQEHFLHRTNELRMLCINKLQKISHSQEKIPRFEKLLEFLKNQKLRSEQIIAQQIQLNHLITESIKQLEFDLSLLKRFNWRAGFQNCIQDFLSGNTKKAQARAAFEKIISNLNLWASSDYSLENVQNLLKFLQQYKRSKLRISEVSYGQNTKDQIQNIISFQDKTQSLEKLIQLTSFQNYLKQQGQTFQSIVFDMPRRAKQVSLSRLNPNSPVHRLFINSQSKQTIQFNRNISIPHKFPFLIQLHSPYNCYWIISNLQSLTYKFENYSSFKFSFQKLPESLKVFRISSSQSTNLTSIDISHLPNLKYFVINTPSLSKAIVKKIVSQAIKNNFRMLCILNDFKEINYSKIGNWEYRFETRANHTYPQLKVCYLDYRRKILQIMLLQRRKLGRTSTIIKESILEYTLSSRQMKEREDIVLSFV